MPTILELFQSSGLNQSVKKDTETLVEQETSGIRIKSAVEINNPLIYGNEAIRITSRTTEAVEKQRTANSSAPADGGLVGKGLSKLTGGKVNSISEARDKVNSTLGIPVNLIPTDVAKGLVGTNVSDTTITLDKIKNGGEGTGVGKFLKGLGGGSPSQMAKQAISKGIDLIKGEIRGELFGRRPADAPAQGQYQNLIPDYGNLVANRQDLQEGKPRLEGGYTYSSTVDISAEAIKDRNDMSTRLEFVNEIIPAPSFYNISTNKFNSDEDNAGKKSNYSESTTDLTEDDSTKLTIDLEKVKYEPQRLNGKKIFGESSSAFRYKSSNTFGDADFDKQRTNDEFCN